MVERVEKNIDASLWEQMDQLRQQVHAHMDAGESPALLALAQSLTRLTLLAQQGQVGAEALTEALHEIAVALDGHSAASTAMTLHALRAALPGSKEEARLAQNHLQVVERLLTAEGGWDSERLDAVQSALLAYGRELSLSDGVDGPSLASLQQTLHASIADQAAALPPPPLAASAAEGARDFQAELLAMMAPQGEVHRLSLAGDGPPEMVLAREPGDGEVDGAGGWTREVTQVAAMQAQVAEARAQLSFLREQHAAHWRDSSEAQAQLAARAAQVAALEQQVLASQRRLAEAQGQAEHREEVAQAVMATQDAARAMLASEMSSLGGIAQRMGSILAQLVVGGSEEQIARVKALAAGSWRTVEQIEGIGSEPRVHDVQQVVAEVQRSVAMALEGLDFAAGSSDYVQLRNLAEQSARAGRRAVQAVTAAHFAMPLPDVTLDVADDVARDSHAYVEAAELLAVQRARYSGRAYQSLLSQDKLLVREETLAPLGDFGRTQVRALAPVPKPEVAPMPAAAPGSRRLEAIQADAKDRLRVIDGLSGSAQADGVAFFATHSGLEPVHNAAVATRLVSQHQNFSASVGSRTAGMDYSGPMARKLNSLMKALGSMGLQASTRRELGFTTSSAFEMAAQDSPLFKRVRFDKGSSAAQDYMPALRKVAGLSHGPLRKRHDPHGADPLRKMDKDGEGIDLRDANLDLVKIIEEKFGNAGPKGEQIAAYGEDPTQGESYQKVVENEFSRVAVAVSQWVGSRLQNIAERGSAKPRDLFVSGQLDPETLVSNLKSEAKQIPTAVREKLAPFIESDVADVKVYTGPIASMASSAMGAHAFTLGKHVFFAQDRFDISSPEGLGLLAHELQHTRHFDRAGTVEQKEQEAEGIEQRVRRAFSPLEDKFLALEDRGRPGGGGQALRAAKSVNDFKVSEPVPPNKGGFRPNYDPEVILDSVTEIILEWMMESFRAERERAGGGE